MKRPASHPASVLERQLTSAHFTGNVLRAEQYAEELRSKYGVRSALVEEYTECVYSFEDACGEGALISLDPCTVLELSGY